MKIDKRELLEKLSQTNLWQNLSAEEVRLYLLLIICADEVRGVFAGHELFTSVTSGVHTVEIQWKKESGGGAALIQEAHISLWRVA